MLQKLYIYDSSTEEDREQADRRFDDDEVWKVGVPSKEALLAELDQLLKKGVMFNRVLFQTHGASGNIEFNGRTIWDSTLKRDFAGRNYHKLFPFYTRIYFDGCNVAADPFGTQLLDAAGEVFLRLGGGEVFGWTSYGYGITWRIPFIGGHTIHFSGGVRKVFFGRGGVKLPPPPAPKEPKERMERGFKI